MVEAAREAGALGACLSGAGSTILAFTDSMAGITRIEAAFFAAAGVAHLAVPDKLLSITPDWAPFAPTVIFLTGVFEFAAVAALPGGAKLINDAKAFSAQTDAYFGLN